MSRPVYSVARAKGGYIWAVWPSEDDARILTEGVVERSDAVVGCSRTRDLAVEAALRVDPNAAPIPAWYATHWKQESKRRKMLLHCAVCVHDRIVRSARLRDLLLGSRETGMARAVAEALGEMRHTFGYRVCDEFEVARAATHFLLTGVPPTLRIAVYGQLAVFGRDLTPPPPIGTRPPAVRPPAMRPPAKAKATANVIDFAERLREMAARTKGGA